MSDEDWDAEDFEPHDVKLPSNEVDRWSGEDEDKPSNLKADATQDVEKQGDSSSVSAVPKKKRQKTLLKERIAEKDEKDKKEQELKKKQEELAPKPQNRKQALEEKHRIMKEKATANIESALEAFGFDKLALQSDPKDESRTTTTTADGSASDVPKST